MRRVQVLAKERAMFSHLIESAMHSTPQGFVGVGLIFVYFVIMMCAIVYRIRKGDQMQHKSISPMNCSPSVKHGETEAATP